MAFVMKLYKENQNSFLFPQTKFGTNYGPNYSQIKSNVCYTVQVHFANTLLNN
jgi:hypothetical protein